MPCAHRVHTECIQRSYLVKMNVPDVLDLSIATVDCASVSLSSDSTQSFDYTAFIYSTMVEVSTPKIEIFNLRV